MPPEAMDAAVEISAADARGAGGARAAVTTSHAPRPPYGSGGDPAHRSGAGQRPTTPGGRFSCSGSASAISRAAATLNLPGEEVRRPPSRQPSPTPGPTSTEQPLRPGQRGADTTNDRCQARRCGGEEAPSTAARGGPHGAARRDLRDRAQRTCLGRSSSHAAGPWPASGWRPSWRPSPSIAGPRSRKPASATSGLVAPDSIGTGLRGPRRRHGDLTPDQLHQPAACSSPRPCCLPGKRP